MNIEMKLQSYGDVECRVPLSKRTTFRIGGTCKYFIYPKNELCLLRILDILEEEGIPHRIFGKGSNILCSDDDYEGAILCLDRYFTDFFFEEEGSCLVQAGASIIMLAHEAMKKSFSGLEFASGIPGTLGGAVFMNAGAYVTGAQLRKLGEYYAKAIYDNYGLDFDVLFGPAYKGIPLTVATTMAISELYGKDIRYCSNRKEVKDHGDTGILLGSKLKDGDRVVIIEDVTTSGKSIEETYPILKAQADVDVPQ